MDFKTPTMNSTVSEWVWKNQLSSALFQKKLKKANGDQRCFGRDSKNQHLSASFQKTFKKTIADHRCFRIFFLKKDVIQRFFRMGLRRPALFPNEFDKICAD